ncbi:hypothetical protein HID58_070842 [Brassica napus]|uniref:Uncharacterized protein n=1 Tax=Brassica napus TaxID=3708 RepID=A0ABQ7YZZ4_BRANA|nr:hypothetical protein HID58_070842 [Brassica napus]
MRAPSVESLLASDESEREGSEREVINSVLVPTIGEQIMLARIIDEERVYDRQASPSCTRSVAKKERQRKGMEERIFEFMGEGFVGLHFTVETKLESLGSRMSDIEKNQRLLRRRAEKIEDMLTSIESKVEPSHGEDMDFRQWDYGTHEENDKANSEKDKANAEQEAGKEKDNIENTEQEAERKNENSDEKEGEEKEADDNAQQEGEKEKENSEADEQDKEDSESESETDELKKLKERSRALADKLWKEIEAVEEDVGGKQDEEEGEEKEAETSEVEKENSEDDEKVEEKVVESEAEGEDDQEEVGGKDDQEEEVEGKESETREQEKEKSETDEVESEAREAEIEKRTPAPPRGNQTEGTPKDDHNEPRVETNITYETPTPPRGNQTGGTSTPPRGKTKAMAARRLVTKPMEEEPGKGEKVVEKVTEGTPKDDHNEPRVETNRTDETPTPPRGIRQREIPHHHVAVAARRLVTKPMEEEPGKGEKVVEEEKKKEEAVETEEKSREKVAEEEKKEEEDVKMGKLLRNILRKKSKGRSWSFTRKHRVLGSCIGARRMPLLLHLRRVADQRGNYSGWRLLSRRGRCVWKTKFIGVTMPKNE